MSGIRGIFFDAFRTLVDFHPSYPGAFAEVCRDFGYPVGERDVARVLPAIERAAREQVARKSDLRCSPEELSRRWVELNKAIFRALGIEGDVAALSHEMERRFDSGAYTRLYPETVAVLEALRERGFRLGVVSNGTAGIARCLEIAGITERVDFVLVSALVGWEKPAREIFLKGLEAVGLEADEVVFVGDDYEADVRGARAVGMEAVLIARAGGPAEADCPVVRDLNEFCEWLDGRKCSAEETPVR